MTNRDRKRTKKRADHVLLGSKKIRKKMAVQARFCVILGSTQSYYQYKQHQSAAFLMKTPKEILLNFVNWFGCPILTDFWSTPFV